MLGAILMLRVDENEAAYGLFGWIWQPNSRAKHTFERQTSLESKNMREFEWILPSREAKRCRFEIQYPWYYFLAQLEFSFNEEYGVSLERERMLAIRVNLAAKTTGEDENER